MLSALWRRKCSPSDGKRHPGKPLCTLPQLRGRHRSGYTLQKTHLTTLRCRLRSPPILPLQHLSLQHPSFVPSLPIHPSLATAHTPIIPLTITNTCFFSLRLYNTRHTMPPRNDIPDRQQYEGTYIQIRYNHGAQRSPLGAKGGIFRRVCLSCGSSRSSQLLHQQL